MIISHKHKFIFLKTEKTAGTSIEVALSKYCGDDDVITRLAPEDERLRAELGHRGAQNYRIPLKYYSLRNLAGAALRRRRLTYRNHHGASEIRAYIDGDVWDSYFKFCFERDPWDKVVSWYYWLYREEPRPSMSGFIRSGRAFKVKGFDLYTIDSRIVVDKVYKYEELSAAMVDIAGRIGLPEVPELPLTKHTFRQAPLREDQTLSAEDEHEIALAFAREIAHFGYQRVGATT